MRLLSLSPEEIAGEIKGMEREHKEFVDQITRMAWFMRGSMTREEMWRLSYFERKVIAKIISENIERLNKTGQPIL